MRSPYLLCAAALLIVLPVASGAANLMTPPYYAQTKDDGLLCVVSNPSEKKTIEVAIAVLGNDGAVVTEATVTVQPLGNRGFQQLGPLPLDGVKCRFSFRGGRRRALGSLQAYLGTDYQVSLEAR